MLLIWLNQGWDPGVQTFISPHPSKTLSVLVETWCNIPMDWMLSRAVVFIVFQNFIQQNPLNSYVATAAVTAKSLHSCPTLCDPIDGSQAGSSIPRILQARLLEWVAIAFSNALMHAKSRRSRLTLCDPPGQLPTRLVCPWDSQGKNTGMGCHFFLQQLCYLP